MSDCPAPMTSSPGDASDDESPVSYLGMYFRDLARLRGERQRRLLPVRAVGFLRGHLGVRIAVIAQLVDRHFMRDHHVLVLDVRPAAEYRAGHIRGARSVPIGELQRRVAELPTKVDVVAYCRGPYCVYADEAVARLRRRGIRARRLDAGFPDWKAAGLPVGVGPTP